jgi:hypothetical protein
MRVDDAAGNIYCSPRHGMRCNPINEGFKMLVDDAAGDSCQAIPVTGISAAVHAAVTASRVACTAQDGHSEH